MKFPDLDANLVKEMMEAARDGPIQKFVELWGGVDVDFHVKDESRSFTRRAEFGLTPQKPDARREETLRMDGEYVVCPGRTALHIAAANGQVEIVSWILGRNFWQPVDINIEDKFGYTPLHFACHSLVNHGDMIDTLMDSEMGRHSLNANAVSRDGVTPLHFAVRGKFKRTVERLLEWKPREGEYYNSTIDVSVKSNEGETPLLLAVHKRREGDHSEELTWIIRRLIRHIKTNCPENINQTDNERKSAVHISIESCDYELMNLILEERGHKVNLDIKDSEGKSAWEVAFQQPHYAVVYKLQNYLECVGLYGNQEAYAGAANAILVVAALLATVTFNSWSLITVAESTLFWVFSSLSFLFAISTLLAAAGAALPSRGSTIADIRNIIHAASFCLAISISCAVGAFATAAFYYAPSIKYKRKVMVTIGIGGIFCLNFLVGFVRRLARAYSPFFLYTDFRSREFLYKHVITRVEGWLVRRKFVRDLKRWYYETVINPAISSIPESKSMGVKGSDDSIEVGTKEGIGR
jgi:ankyrin repeat protein